MYRHMHCMQSINIMTDYVFYTVDLYNILFSYSRYVLHSTMHPPCIQYTICINAFYRACMCIFYIYT